MDYKNSMYNIVINKDENYTMIWNSFNGAIIKLENEIAQQLLNNKISSDLKYFNDLLETGIIIEENIDEYLMVKEKEQEILQQEQNKMSIVITPTLKCNYRCIYCFEAGKEKKKVMDYSDADKVINYIENKCKTLKLKNLVITWFGGEPMLCYDIILYIGEKVKQICEKYSVEFGSRMITNGSLLNLEKTKNMVEKCNLKLLQITVDGLEEEYIQKKGTNKQSFEKVINNIIELSSLVRIKVRLNVDKSNYDEVVKVANFLLVEKNLKNKIDIYFAEIKNYNKDEGTSYYNLEEATKARYYFYDDLYNRGLIKKRHIAPISFDPLFCGFKSKNNVVIGPDGNVYKCQHYLDQEDKVVGNLENDCKNKKVLEEFYHPKNSEICKKCNLYPVCRYNCCPALHDLIEIKNDRCSIYDDQLKSIIFQCENYNEEE